MRGFLVKELQHPSKILLTTNCPEPAPKCDDILVDVYSAGLNFFDILQAQGKYQHKPQLPFILGTEFAGKVAYNSPIPTGCPYRAGDRVFGASQGAYADKIAVPWRGVMPLPGGLSFNEGAGSYVTWATSYEALVGRAELKPDEWVLVTAAAGGVGIAAVQIAKALGAKVFAAAGSEAKLGIARRVGADHGVNYTHPGWQKDVLKVTQGRGVDVIFDPVGLINDCLKCIAWKGRALVVGFAGGTVEKVPMNFVLLKNVSLVGVNWGAYTTKEKSRIPEVWKNLLSLFASGRLKPIVYKIYSLEELLEGLTALERRETWGKVVIEIRKDNTKMGPKL